MNITTKRFLASAILTVILFSTTSCSSTSDNQTEESTIPQTTSPASETETQQNSRPGHQVPEMDLEGAEFNIAYSEWQGYTYYFFADEFTGDVMNDAIYDRTVRVQEYCNVDLTQTNLPDLNDVVAQTQSTVLADSDVYSLSLIHCIAGVSDLATGGYVYNFDKLPYVNLQADWWNREQMDVLRLGKNTYYGVSDYMIPCPYAIFFNKEMIVDNNMDDPYQLVYDGTWTLDKMVDMAISVTQDLDGDGAFTMNDVAGITADEPSKYISFITGCNQFITEKGTDGRIQLAMYNEKTVHIVETLYKLVENPGTLFYSNTKNENEMFPMDSGQLLFRLGTITTAEVYRDCEVDIGILPYPKYDEAQKQYVSQDWGGLMCIPASIRDTNKVGAVLELLSYESSDTVIPAYYDVLLAGKLSRDEDTKNMLDILFDTIAYEVGGNYFGFSTGFFDLFYTAGNLVVENKSADFASWYARNEPAAKAAINKFYEALDKAEADS